MFIACHPVLSRDARVALTLRMLGGLRTDEIARAFLVPEPTVAQRIVRAKRTLAPPGSPSSCRPGPSWATASPRCSRSSTSCSTRATRPRPATTGCDPSCATRRCGSAACSPAWRPTSPRSTAWWRSWRSRPRGRAPARRRPASRCCCSTRTAGCGTRPRSRRGLAALDRASALGGARGPYALQAAIAACHARARTADATDWGQIAALYDALAQLTPSPVVELNRAVALSMAFGPATGLEVVDTLVDEPTMQGYHLLPGVRGDLLDKLGRRAEAAPRLRAGRLPHPQRPGAGGPPRSGSPLRRRGLTPLDPSGRAALTARSSVVVPSALLSAAAG